VRDCVRFTIKINKSARYLYRIAPYQVVVADIHLPVVVFKVNETMKNLAYFVASCKLGMSRMSSCAITIPYLY